MSDSSQSSHETNASFFFSPFPTSTWQGLRKVWQAVWASPVRPWPWSQSWTCPTPRSSTCPARSVYNRHTARVNNTTPVIHSTGIQWGFPGGATLTAPTHNDLQHDIGECGEGKNCFTAHEFLLKRKALSVSKWVWWCAVLRVCLFHFISPNLSQ